MAARPGGPEGERTLHKKEQLTTSGKGNKSNPGAAQIHTREGSARGAFRFTSALPIIARQFKSISFGFDLYEPAARDISY